MVLLMEGIVSLLQSQFDYSTDSCHSGTEVTLFHVIIHYIQPYHIITIHHHSFPTKTWLLSSAVISDIPTKQAVLVKQGEAPPQVVGGFNEMEALAELNEERCFVTEGDLFKGYTCLLDLLGKNVVSVFRRIFFCA